MNVLNDKSKERSEKQVVDPFQILTLAFFFAAGIATFLLAPLPIILAQVRIPEPWPKVAALGGAAVALLLLEVPVGWVALSFVLAIVFADQLPKRRSVWSALAAGSTSAAAVAALLVFWHASLAHSPPWVFWTGLVHGWVEQFKESVQSGMVLDWAALERLLTYQGPFLVISGGLISCWLSLGVACHLGWIDPKSPFAATGLRARLRVPPWFCGVAGLAISATLAFKLPIYLVGAVRILGCILFIAGSVCLSDALSRRKAVPWARTLVYLISVVFGFYAVVALGMISPWYFRASRSLEALRHFEEKK